MKSSSILTILQVLLLVATIASIAEGKRSKAIENESLDIDPTLSTTNNDAIEENPDFVEYDENDGNGNSDDDSEGDDEEEEEDKHDDEINEQERVCDIVASDTGATKKSIESVLRKSRQQYKRYTKLAKKHRRSITITLAVFAFRHEICKFLVHLMTHEIIDPKTGKLRVSPTSLLKFFLFVDFVRRLQSGRNASHPSFQALASLGESNPFMGVFFSRFLRVPMFNPAFIPPISQHYTFERINERYIKDGMALHKAIHAKHDGFKWPTAETAITRSMIAGNRTTEIQPSNETVIVVDMTSLDTSVSTMDQIRDQVSFLLSQYRVAAMIEPTDLNENATSSSQDMLPSPFLEVVVLLESPGGSAADYGLAAQQLLRLRKQPGIILTICVDKVAASGGYMMACTATPGQLLAAPFAVVGSIGVLGQIVNAQKLLEGWGLSPLVFRGGKDKAPLGVIGEITQEGKDKTQAMIDVTHEAFQQHVIDARPLLKKHIKKVGTGEIFIGKGALEAGLIDKIITSDEYISSKVAKGARVLKLVKNRKARFPFATNFDNYDTTLDSRQYRSLSNLLWSTWKTTARYLGVEADLGTDSFRQAVSIVQSPKVCTS